MTAKRETSLGPRAAAELRRRDHGAAELEAYAAELAAEQAVLEVAVAAQSARRDRFAAAALTGLLAQEGGRYWSKADVCSTAWWHATEMLLTEPHTPPPPPPANPPTPDTRTETKP